MVLCGLQQRESGTAAPISIIIMKVMATIMRKLTRRVFMITDQQKRRAGWAWIEEDDSAYIAGESS